MTEITAEIAKEFLDYVPETGKLFWRKRDRKWFEHSRKRSPEHAAKAWNSRYAGKEAFTAKNAHGYQQGAIFDRLYFAHRLVWLLQTGSWPSGQIDHINHVRSDNRWGNLREVTNAENGRNQSSPKDNTSGVVGVGWSKRAKKWRARIHSAGTSKHIGLFDTFEEAASARRVAEKKLGFHENHGRAVA